MDLVQALSTYPEILEVGESGVKGLRLSIHQLLDQRLLFFSQPLPYREWSLNLFPLLPLNQGPPLLHGGIGHDHCELTKQVSAYVPLQSHPPPASIHHWDYSFKWGQREPCRDSWEEGENTALAGIPHHTSCSKELVSSNLQSPTGSQMHMSSGAVVCRCVLVPQLSGTCPSPPSLSPLPLLPHPSHSLSFFMPLSRHLRNRQAWHCRRVFRVISQVPLRKGHLSRTLRFMALLWDKKKH